MPKVIEFVWRRQLAAAARRRIMRASSEGGTESVLVGFADLVGFTAKTQQLEETELAEVVGRFETVAYDVVAEHGGRVVKMIGDEVMLIHDDPREGAALALDLAERFRDDDNLSDVRVGLACGSVLERDGDVYGNVVNLANRIVSVAYPGTVVISEDLADRVARRRGVRVAVVAVALPARHRPCAAVHTAAGCRSHATPRTPGRAAVDRDREFLRERWIGLREDAEKRSIDLPAPIAEEFLAPASSTEPSTGQFEAITEAVLEADLDQEMQVALLSDLEAARRLRELESEAEREGRRGRQRGRAPAGGDRARSSSASRGHRARGVAGSSRPLAEAEEQVAQGQRRGQSQGEAGCRGGRAQGRQSHP